MSAFVDPRARLREAGLTPKRSFGQNFLVSEGVTRAIAEACVETAELHRARVVELGAGTGALTGVLLERAAWVCAVERDRELLPLLARAFGDAITGGSLALLEQDAQAIDLASAFGEARNGARVLCGNLPYQITGSLLARTVQQAEQLDRVVFMVQQEVAERLLAAPGTKTYGALTIFVRAAFVAERVRNVAPGCFFPSPDVTSTVLRLLPRRPRLADETETFRALVRSGFAMRRKTLRNAWHALVPSRDALEHTASNAGISLDRRAETLTVEDFATMAKLLDGGS